MAKDLTTEELDYIIKACQNLPIEDQNDEVIDSLTPKLHAMYREAVIGEWMGLDQP